MLRTLAFHDGVRRGHSTHGDIGRVTCPNSALHSELRQFATRCIAVTTNTSSRTARLDDYCSKTPICSNNFRKNAPCWPLIAIRSLPETTGGSSWSRKGTRKTTSSISRGPKMTGTSPTYCAPTMKRHVHVTCDKFVEHVLLLLTLIHLRWFWFSLSHSLTTWTVSLGWRIRTDSGCAGHLHTSMKLRFLCLTVWPQNLSLGWRRRTDTGCTDFVGYK